MKVFIITMLALILASCATNPRYNSNRAYVNEYFVIAHIEANHNFVTGTATTGKSLDDGRFQLIDGYVGEVTTVIKCQWKVNSYTYFQYIVSGRSCKQLETDN